MSLIDLTGTPELELAPGINARVVTGEGLTVTHVVLDEGAVLPMHAHPHEQIVNVMEGELELTVAGETHLLTRGKVMVLPSNVPHEGRALTRVFVVDVFQPVREDLKAASEQK